MYSGSRNGRCFGSLALEFQGSSWLYSFSSISLLPLWTLSLAGPSAVTNIRMPKGALLTFQRQFQACHRPPFYRKMTFSHSSNPRHHQALTRNSTFHKVVKRCPWEGTEASAQLLIPEARAGEQTGLQTCFQDSGYEIKDKDQSSERSCFKHSPSSSALDAKPTIRTPEHQRITPFRWPVYMNHTCGWTCARPCFWLFCQPQLWVPQLSLGFTPSPPRLKSIIKLSHSWIFFHSTAYHWNFYYHVCLLIPFLLHCLFQDLGIQ